MAENEYATREAEPQSGGLTSSPVFPALVALWFAALFGGGCLFLPQIVFDAALGESSPLGANTRIIAALVAAGIGLVLGLFIASRVRSDLPERAASEREPAPNREFPQEKTRKRRIGGKSKDDTRPPLDIRSALGLGHLIDDDDEEEDAHAGDRPKPHAENDDEYTLSDELVADDDVDETRPPIDDPYFASAWSDSGTYDLKELEVTRKPEPDARFAPRPFDDPHAAGSEWQSGAPRQTEARPETGPQTDSHDIAPPRYNPFADFVKEDEEPQDLRSFSPREAETPPEAEEPRQPARPQQLPPLEGFEELSRAMRAAAASPPPPAWPTPRAEEPELTELGVAELVERLARALQGEDARAEAEMRAEAHAPFSGVPRRTGDFRYESALASRPAPPVDVDRALRQALERLSRLDDVA